MQSTLIPRDRLKHIPRSSRLAHEYCFFLHDMWVQMVGEYERAEAHHVKIPFRNGEEKKRFLKLAKSRDSIAALRAIDRNDEARRVVLNQITLAMVSDCAHHVYEALRCFEKRKYIPGFNLLRKPLLETLTYLAWIVSDEADFYAAFVSGDPTQLSQKRIGNRRIEFFEGAVSAIKLDQVLTAGSIVSSLYDTKNEYGLYGLFQHAVHLVTVDRVEIRTTPENFNFIFKSSFDDDIYEALYETLPEVLLFLSHVILCLFERIAPAEEGAVEAFKFRSTGAFRFLQARENADTISRTMEEEFSHQTNCVNCSAPLKFTKHNTARVLLTDSYRCATCRQVSWFPLSSMF